MEWWEHTFFNRLLIAIPELSLNIDFMEEAVKRGWVSKEGVRRLNQTMRTGKKAKKTFEAAMGADTVMGRIAAVAPELLSVSSVDLLRRLGLVDKTTANALRIVLGGAKVLTPTFSHEATILARIEALYGSVVNGYMVNFVRELETAQIEALRNALLGGRTKLSPEEAAVIKRQLLKSIQRAQIGRSAISAADILADTAKAAASQKSVWGALTLIMDNIFGSSASADKMLRNAIRAGVIDKSNYELIRSIQKLGANVWRKSGKAFEYESWAARGLLLSEGILSPEMVSALRAAGVIPDSLARPLHYTSRIIRGITRGQLEHYIGRTKYHPVAGETPIQTYARVTQRTDQALLRLLRDASIDAQKVANASGLKKGIGGQVRAAQQRAVVASINSRMRELWESMGHLTIFGEKEAARAGVESISWMSKHLFGGEEALRRSLLAESRAGVEAFIGREENIKPLAKSVYRSMSLGQGLVQREIQKALIRGVSADELAKIVRQFIRPDVAGGVSYAAMRLARTEINNAFHFSQIQNSRDMPWVTGYHWHRSGRHGSKDICDEYATRNHDGLGRGVFDKKFVPGKPHPNCLCFITTETVSDSVFERRLRSGAYNQYIDLQRKGNSMGVQKADTVRDAGMDWVKDSGLSLGKAAVQLAGAKLIDVVMQGL